MTVYGSGISARDEVPGIKIPGLTWKQADDPSLLSEVYNCMIDRSETDRWWDTCFLSFATLLFAFGYAFTRYSELVNGSYPYTMVPLYITDKAIAWTGLWMFVAAPFAGNILALEACFSNWRRANMIDALIILVSVVTMIVPVFLYAITWIVWSLFRNIFFCASPLVTPFGLYKDQGKVGNLSLIKATLVDLVSLRRETGIIGFFYSFAHGFAGAILCRPYKGSWFQDNGKLYGHYELSLACGIVGFSIITSVMIRSLFKGDSWMKQKPVYNYAAPLGIFLAILHLFFMGYKGWDSLFDPSSHNGQPSPNFTASMFPLGVLGVNIFLTIFGTKKRIGTQSIWKHSLTNAAVEKYERVKNEYHGKFHDGSIANVKFNSFA